MAVDPFDFTKVDDLPEELQKAVSGRARGGTSPNTFVEVIRKGKEAGHAALTLGQIKAAAHRMGIKIPSDQTLRKALENAEKAGLIVKPSRQSYAIA